MNSQSGLAEDLVMDTKHQEYCEVSRYQDYVIKNGRFIGEFEEMYRNSSQIPWHQDETVNSIFSDMCVVIIRRCMPASLLDVGCGLGYMAERLRSEIDGLENIVGLDVSETATARAKDLFPLIRFVAGDLKSALPENKFEMVVSKDVLWYVLDDLDGYLNALVARSSRHVYIGQSFPATKPYYGEDVLPNAAGLIDLLRQSGFDVVYQLIERDACYGNREYAHALLKLKI